jgi:PmbA protein
MSALSRSKVCLCYAFAIAEEGDKNAMGGTGLASRLFRDVDGAEIVDRAYRDCLDILDGGPVPSKHYDVIFDQECQISMFDAFASMFSGKSAKDGVNPMREKVGEVIADTRLTLRDSPLLTEGLGYALFDAEGTATGATPLIVDGRLETLAHNSATASHFGLQTTGHASRSPRSILGVRLHQMEIAAGSDDDASLKAGEYLELTDLDG